MKNHILIFLQTNSNILADFDGGQFIFNETSLFSLEELRRYELFYYLLAGQLTLLAMF